MVPSQIWLMPELTYPSYSVSSSIHLIVTHGVPHFIPSVYLSVPLQALLLLLIGADGPFPKALQALIYQGWSEFSLSPLCIKLHQRSIKAPCVLMFYGKFHETVFLDRAEIHQVCPGKGCFSVLFGQCLYHSGC